MNFYQDVFFKSLDMLRGRQTITRLHELRKSQFWPLEKLREVQLAKLNRILLSARDGSPFYRERLADIKLPFTSLKEIEQIPILSKNDIRQFGEEIKNKNIEPKRFVASRTGGSTGEPMHYFWDKRGMDWNRGSVYRAGEWGDTALGENTVQMSGSHFDYSQAQKLSSQLILWAQRYKDLSVATLTDDKIRHYLDEIEKFKPTSIWGYASGLSHVSRWVVKHNAYEKLRSVKAVMTSSETLSPEMREVINQAFQGEKVFDQYGSRELYMGSECSAHDGYHIHSEVILHELLDSNNEPVKPGEMGRVVLTDLTNEAFPFVRYENGDMATETDYAPCSCGVTLPKIAKVNGRIADMITLKSAVLTPPNFATLMSDFKGIKHYQIRQPRIDYLEILIVPDHDFDEGLKSYVTSATNEMVNNEAEVVVKIVDDIPVPESGKRRFIVSDVASSYL